MDSELPRVTIIVPTKPGQAEIKSVEAARRLDYPKDKLEILVARGKQSAQRIADDLRRAVLELGGDRAAAPGAGVDRRAGASDGNCQATEYRRTQARPNGTHVSNVLKNIRSTPRASRGRRRHTAEWMNGVNA